MARLKKGARQQGLILGFLDEFGLMLQPVRRRTWAPCGQTPRQRVWGRHDRLSGIGAITVTPHRQRLSFAFQLLPHNVRTEDLVWFLTAMHRHYRRKIVLIWDRWSVHRSVVKSFQRHHPDWFQFEELPGYSPELNPVEPCGKHCQYDDLANFAAEDIDHLHAEATASLEALRDDQDFLRSAFNYCKLKL